VAIQKTGYKIFTGLSQGIVKVLKDSEVQKEETAQNIASSEWVSEEEGDGTSAPLEKQQMQERKLLPSSNLPQQIKGPL
jgi:hypothetical protein